MFGPRPRRQHLSVGERLLGTNSVFVGVRFSAVVCLGLACMFVANLNMIISVLHLHIIHLLVQMRHYHLHFTLVDFLQHSQSEVFVATAGMKRLCIVHKWHSRVRLVGVIIE